MTIKIYQTYYDERHLASLDPQCFWLDVRSNPNPEYYEFPIYFNLYDQWPAGVNLMGLFSWKFFSKCKLPISDVLNFINKNPGNDIYLFNPFPQNKYFSFNVWDQGELSHPGLINAADTLFKKLNLNYTAHNAPRNTDASLVYCNYWVANRNFWKEFIGIARKISDLLDGYENNDALKLLHHSVHHSKPSLMFPFVFERIVSTIISQSEKYKVAHFEFTSKMIHDRCITPMERLIVDLVKDYIDCSDNDSDFDKVKNIVSILGPVNKEYGDMYFKNHPFPF